MTFTIQVKVDGADIASLTLAGARITYGRQTLQEQPNVPVAVLELLTRDAWPQASMDYPEFGLGDWASDLSGFVQEYGDEYAGSPSRITIGVPVSIDAGTESGFVQEYGDTYTGVKYRRFTGRVQAIDYRPGTITLTATPRSEEWARIYVGGTIVDQTIPVEYETARAIRYAAEAGIELYVDGPPSVQVNAVPPETEPSSLMGHLVELMNDTGGLVFTDRESYVHVRTRDWVNPDTTEPLPLPPGTTLLDPLVMSLDLSLVRNRVTVTYGPEATQDGGQVLSGHWKYRTGGPPPPVNEFRYVSDGSPATGETITLHVSHTDLSGGIWAFDHLTTAMTAAMHTAAGDSAVIDITALDTPTTGPTGYTSITGTITEWNGDWSNNEDTTLAVYNPDVKTRPTVTVEDTASIAQYGVRDAKFTTIIESGTDAITVAQRLLSLLSPQWSMPDATIALNLATDGDVSDVMQLEQGSPVLLPQLPLGAPQPDYESVVLGYEETLSTEDWRIALHLSPQFAYETTGALNGL